ncbi:MAG: T9SS type B sorting domain-containing protein [Polaribacter sp.]|uniref:T9SS type B sorting domain-containing protein n=1 Tax=Polaribacter sp. TaxID=1920175 RepID=UPI003EF48C17
MRKSFPHVLLFFICFITFQNINAQLSRKHFIPPLTYAENGNANPENQYFYISTPSNQNVSYTITQIGSNDDITGTVTNTSPQEISIGTGDTQLFIDSGQTSVVHSNKGYIIEASDVIYVSIRVLAGGGAQAGALVSKGSSALGTSFRAGMFTNENPQDNYLNFISVMATEDNTIVDFDDLPVGILIKNYSGSLPISNILLNEGESYVVATNSFDNTINRDGLIGTLITSDKPIVVNTGSANGSFHNGNGRDYGIDQIVGIDKVGSEYIFVKGNGSNDWENVLIVAHEDHTEVFINGNTTSEKTINAGEYYLIEGNKYSSNGNMYVKTSYQVFAYQGIGANNNEANQGLFFVPPLSCENRGKVDNIPNIEDIGNTTFTGGITIVTNIGATVNINSQPIANYSTSGPFNVDGNSNYVTYKVTNLTGSISIDSTDELYCAYFNQNGSASSGSFFSGFPSNPEIKFNVAISTLGNCLGNDLKLQAANTELFDSFKWYFNDGSGYIDTNETSATLIPTAPGSYQLIGKIDCTNTTFESSEIPVSICPDDYDNDGIIDNVDADIDNDGILNYDESLGNKTIDLSDINNPTVENNLTAVSASLTTENTTFTGNSTGDFISTANASGTSNSKYTLDFDDNINFKLTQNSTTNHTISNNEYFIIKLSQTEKNITLIDPDNQILIDSNFDDEFEDDFTQFSASVIKFKFKENLVAGTSTFQFVANQITNISFEHYNNISRDISTFNGTIGLTCFTLDSDGDGIENMFDLDADNDGIPDLYDAYGQDISLTKTDANLDGLDDVFGTITTNLDADADDVKNYLDYDSDNDGIYDVIESGNGDYDTDNDGKINGTVGTNGLLDDLETSPDSGVLKTPLKNSDSTTLIITNQDSFFDFVDLDSDGDDCFDVIEAGFRGNGSGILYATPFAVDDKGKVINNSNGYSDPNLDYITSAPIQINTPLIDVIFCEGDTDTITIDSNADSFQWEVSTDDGATWNTITDNAVYLGSNTKSLQITNTPFTYNSYQYKVTLNRIGNSCGFTSDEITLTVNPKPVLLSNLILLKQCADDVSRNTIVNLTETEINLIDTPEDFTFEYYETETDAISGEVSKLISDIENYPVTNGIAEAGVRIISDKGCYSTAKIEVEASYAGDVLYDKVFEECDDFTNVNDEPDGITNFNFREARQDVINLFPLGIQGDIEVYFYETSSERDAAINEISDISNHRNTSYAYNQTIYIKIKNKNNNDCEGIGKLTLKTKAIPEFTVDGEVPNDPIIICTENIPYTLSVNTIGDYNYEWLKDGTPFGGNAEEIIIADAGIYTVTAFSKTTPTNTKACSKQRTITVYKSDFENLEESFVTITDDLSIINSNLNIRIDIPRNPLINEEFLYALEDENGMTIRSYQDSNVFEDIEGGIYKIIVENKNGCGSSELIVSVIQFPKFFTPNGDRKNDTWAVKGINTSLYQSNSTINIFNRYGKLVAQTTINSDGWDGTYNGKLLASNDYWFSVQLIPIDTEKKPILKKGHFSLLRK